MEKNDVDQNWSFDTYVGFFESDEDDLPGESLFFDSDERKSASEIDFPSPNPIKRKRKSKQKRSSFSTSSPSPARSPARSPDPNSPSLSLQHFASDREGERDEDDDDEFNEFDYSNASKFLKDEEEEEEEDEEEDGEDVALVSGSDVHDPEKRAVHMDESTFRWNIFSILCVCLIGEAARGLTVATLPLYMGYLGGSSFLFTLTVSFFSVGRMMGGMVLGALSHRWSIRRCIRISMIFCVIGNLMYAMAILFTPDPTLPINSANAHPTVGVYIVFMGRFLVGFGSSTVVLVRVYLSLITSPAERTRYISWANAAQFLGSSVLPGLGIVLFIVPEFSIGEFQITGYNSPGLVLAFMDVACIAIVSLFMSSLSPQKIHGKSDTPTKASAEQGKLQKIGGILFVFFNFDTRSAVSFIETAGTVMFLRTMQPDCDKAASSASMFFFILGLGGFFVFFICEHLNKIFSSLTLLSSSFFMIGLGLFMNINWRIYHAESLEDEMGEDGFSEGIPQVVSMYKWKFVLGCIFIWSLGSPISQVMMISSFSRLLGQKPQGKWQGLIASGGSIGRILAPLLVTLFLLDCWGCPGEPEYCYHNDPDSDGDYDGPDHTNIIFFLSSGLTFLAFFVLLGFRYYLKKKGGDVLAMINASKTTDTGKKD